MSRLLCLLLLLVAVPCRAETVTFRSGEHAGFSRLVLDIPRGADWELSPQDGDYLLRMDPAHDFDTSAAFDRIPRNRLAALATDRGQGLLTLSLACDCHAAAFLFRPDKLVIDILDGPPPDITPVAGPEPDADSATTPFRRFPVVPEPLVALPGRPPLATESMPSGLPDPFAAALEIETIDTARISAAEQSLIESLSRANAQGIVEFLGPDIPVLRPAMTQDEVVPVQPDHMVDAAADMTGIGITEPGTVPGVIIETAIDRGTQLTMPRPTARSGNDCLDAALFDLGAWGDGRPFHAQIADRTSALTGEFDNYTDGAVESLARTYLHFGFGREAQQALQLDGRRSPEREIIASIAAIIDDTDSASGILATQSGCIGPVALWSALARGSVVGAPEAERTAMVTAHRLLPTDLRQPIGLRLADLFLKAGDHAGAAQILASDINQVAQDAVQVGLAEAEIARQSIGPEPAIDRLTGMVDEGARMTAAAMTELLTLSVAEGRPVDDATLELAAAVRFESRGTVDAATLAVAEIRALIAADRFDMAAGIIADVSTGIPSESLTALESDLYVAIADRMIDAEFLDLAFGSATQDLTDRAANAMAGRLIQLGFPEEANRILAAPATGDDMAERRYLRAEAAIALGRADDAWTALAGMSGARAEAIRARIVGAFPDVVAQQDTAPDRLPDAAPSFDLGLGPPAVPPVFLPDQAPAEPQLPAETLAARRLILEDAARARALAEQTLASGLADQTATQGTD